MLLIIDNYDSFTYNIAQYFEQLGQVVVVRANDAISLADISELAPDYLVISPGPKTPAEAGISLAAIETFAGQLPILGVCLGHQAIGQAFGAEVVRADDIMHGRTSAIYHNGTGIFAGLPSPFNATRYHSLVIQETSLPNDLLVTAWANSTRTRNDSDRAIMGIRHRQLPIEGVQFHPESILSEQGLALFNNFLQRYA